MSLLDSDRQEELFLIIGDQMRMVNRRLLAAFLAVVVLSIPGYFLIKYLFVQSFSAQYVPPAVLTAVPDRTPVQVLEKKIFKINSNTYSGYARLSNVNLDWGVPDQAYRVRVTSKGGTVLTDFSAKTFLLPSSQKVVVLPRFSADVEPYQFDLSLEPSKFIARPQLPEVKLEVQRTELKVENGSQIVTAVVINRSAFKVNRIDLPAVLYDSKNQPVAASFTNVNEVLSGETRSFQYFWPNRIDGAARAEIAPEINVFLPNIIQTEASKSQFD